MLESILAAFGSLFASGPALLLLAALAALIPLLWDWRVALGALLVVQIAVSLLLAYLHRTPGLVTSGQIIAVLVAGGLLLLAQWLRRGEPPPRQPASWLVRVMALTFVAAAWWFLDPGIGLPMMAQPEVDILVWIAICALFVTTLTADPFFAGVALLLWLLPAYAIASALLPTTGLPAILGIAEILVALASSYLILMQPRRRVVSGARIPVVPLPQAQPVRTLRLPGLGPRRPVIAAGQLAPAAEQPVTAPAAVSQSTPAAPGAPGHALAGAAALDPMQVK